MPVSRQRPSKDEEKASAQTCLICGRKKARYTSKSIMHSKGGKLPWCKDCLTDLYDGFYRRFEDSNRAMVELCKFMNYPYFSTTFESARQRSEKGEIDILGAYFSTVHTKIDKLSTFLDSDIFPEGTSNSLSAKDITVASEALEKAEKAITKGKLKNKEDLETLFGAGYTDDEYRAMKKKYDFLKNNYPGKTSMHIEALATYVTYKVKQEFATATNDDKASKIWANLADTAATNAKINPSQLSQRDLQNGAGSFAEISEIVEQAKDIIPILPQFKNQPRDAADFIIWQYINYERDLSGLPLCAYKDVYKFFDERKEAYIKQYGDPYGIFENDPTESNRDKIESFIRTEEEDKIDSDLDAFEDGGDQ
ncbi:MAG: hypothetical protein PHT30_04630 [Bacilli bacterium]|nr:hypothetical protein [Bacilli bacterium]